MLYITKINDVDFTPWLREDGVQQRSLRRQSRRVVGLDGTLYFKVTEKRELTLRLLELRDVTKDRLMAALTCPATVAYTDLDRGDITRVFYITSLSGGVKTVRGGNTYWSGITVTMEEK